MSNLALNSYNSATIPQNHGDYTTFINYRKVLVVVFEVFLIIISFLPHREARQAFSAMFQPDLRQLDTYDS